MGLSEPRKRSKISHDPNNTNWSRSTTSFGQKILKAQGWREGDFLGARNTPHANSYTAANSSHIRIALKDDNLGLGARKGSKQPEHEPAGLDAFQGLLGRLNGKSESQLEKEQKTRDDVRLALYAATRWSSVQFVSGGLLVQEEVQAISDSKPNGASDGSIGAEQHEKQARKCEKRRRKDAGPQVSGSGQGESRKNDNESNTIGLPKTISLIHDVRDENGVYGNPIQNHDAKEVLGSTRKRKKKPKKSYQHNIGSFEAGEVPPPTMSTESESPRVRKKMTDTGQRIESQEPRTTAGRRAIRNRYIQQKNMAFMDSKALEEIFMGKS